MNTRSNLDTARKVDRVVNYRSSPTGRRRKNSTTTSGKSASERIVEECVSCLHGNESVKKEFVGLIGEDLMGYEGKDQELQPLQGTLPELSRIERLVLRVIKLDIVSSKDENKRLCPKFVILSDGRIKSWCDGSTLRFLAPISMKEKHLKDHVRKCIHKWLLDGLQYNIDPGMVENVSAILESESEAEFDDSSSSSSESSSEDEEDEDEEDDDDEESSGDEESTTAIKPSKVDEEEETKDEEEEGFTRTALTRLRSFSIATKDLSMFSTSSTMSLPTNFWLDDEVNDYASAAEEEENGGPRIVVRKNKLEYGQVDHVIRSKFAPFRETWIVYSFKVVILGMKLDQLVKMQSSVPRVMENPTLQWHSRYQSSPDKLKLCWSWSKGIVEEDEKTVVSTPRGVLPVTEEKFTFAWYFANELSRKNAINSEGGVSVEVLRKLLVYKCRFSQSKIDEIFANLVGSGDVELDAGEEEETKEDVNKAPHMLSRDQLKTLCSVLDDIIVSTINNLSLSQEDRQVVRGLFPHSCNIQLSLLAGGFSGAIVLQTISYDIDGRAEDSTVLKLDTPDSIREEEKRHRMMITYLGDHAPVVLGRYFATTRAGIKIALAGEQSIFRGIITAQQSNHLLTLKDLYLFEQDQIDFGSDTSTLGRPDPKMRQICLDKIQKQKDAVEFLTGTSTSRQSMSKKKETTSIAAIHSVHNVLLEVFGEVFEKCTVQSASSLGKRRGDFRTKLYNVVPVLRKTCFLDLNQTTNALINEIWDPAVILSQRDLGNILNIPHDSTSTGTNHPGRLYDYLIHLCSWLQGGDASNYEIEYYQGVTHGDLNAANIIVDSKGMPWVIDFMHSGIHHVLRDIIKLTSCVLLEYMEVKNDQQLQCAIRMIDDLARCRTNLKQSLPTDLDRDVVSPLLSSIHTSEGSKESIGKLQLAWQSCRMLREYCSKYVRDAHDIRQWHIGMLYFSLQTLGFKDVNIYQKRLALASVLIHSGELLKVNRLKWRPADASPRKTSKAPVVPPSPSKNDTELVITNSSPANMKRIPSTTESTTSSVVSVKIRHEIHMKSYLNRIAIKCGQHIDPISREMFTVSDSVDIDVHSIPMSKKKQLQQQTDMARTTNINSATNSSSLSTRRRKKPPPLQLDPASRAMPILNERSSQFFEYVRSTLKIDMVNHGRRIAIIGPSSSGKTVKLKKLVTNAMLQDFYIPVYLELQDICKFLRRKIDTSSLNGSSSNKFKNDSVDALEIFRSRSLSNHSSSATCSTGNASSSNSSSPYTMNYWEYMEHQEESSCVKPLSSLARAAKFFADSPSVMSPSSVLSSKQSKQLQQRDILRLHQQEILQSPLSSTMPDSNRVMTRRTNLSAVKAASPSSLNTRKKYLRNHRIKQLTHHNNNTGLDLLELYWSYRYGESSPMFEILSNARKNRQILLFLDGLDEMRCETRQDLLTWLDTTPEIISILTSRRAKDLRGQVHKFCFVHIKPLHDAHVGKMISSHVERFAKKFSQEDLSGGLQRFLQEELRKPLFKEITAGSPLLVNLLIFALSNHWRMSNMSDGNSKMAMIGLLKKQGSFDSETNSGQTLTGVEDIDWGVPQILHFAVLHLIQADRQSGSSQLEECTKLCMTDDGVAFFESMAFEMHMKRESNMLLGTWVGQALENYLDGEEDRYKRGLLLANSVTQLIRAGTLSLIQQDSGGGKQVIDQSFKFSIHILQEYLCAGYICKRIHSIANQINCAGNGEALQKFFLFLNVKSKNQTTNWTEQDDDYEDEDEGELDEEEEDVDCEVTDESSEEDDFREDYLSDCSSVSGTSAGGTSTSSSNCGGSFATLNVANVRRFKLLSDGWWQNVFYLTLKMLVPHDLDGHLSALVFKVLFDLIGSLRFSGQLAKFVRHIIKTGDDNMLQTIFNLFVDSKIEAGAGANVLRAILDPGGDQTSPLIYAARRGHAFTVALIVDFILQYCQNSKEVINRASALGETALMVAAEHGFKDVVTVLLENGGDVNYSPPDGSGNALYLTCYENHYECAVLLLENGADPNSHCEGTSCLFNAAYDGETELCLLLLEHGADPSSASPSGHSCIGIAKQEGHHQLVELLKQYSCDGSS